MKIDMHCHTKEGSIDGKVPIEEYIRMLRNQGFGGMLVTDHDSYGGYRQWKKNIKGDKYTDFLVLKGIEYDTLDAGHIIVIMPENIKLRLLDRVAKTPPGSKTCKSIAAITKGKQNFTDVIKIIKARTAAMQRFHTFTLVSS